MYKCQHNNTIYGILLVLKRQEVIYFKKVCRCNYIIKPTILYISNERNKKHTFLTPTKTHKNLQKTHTMYQYKFYFRWYIIYTFYKNIYIYKRKEVDKCTIL